ncbi:hypothetical protein [Agromyces sp. NPDC055661]
MAYAAPESPIALIIAGVVMVAVGALFAVARQAMVDLITVLIPPADTAFFQYHGRTASLILGIVGIVVGVLFVASGAAGL